MTISAFVFDCDDTLYDEIDFVKSGFWAVATTLFPENRVFVFSRLLSVFFEHGSGQVFDRLLREGFLFDVSEAIRIYRYHTPQLGLPLESRILLEWCSSRAPLALLTDGDSQTQRNKIDALGLDGQFAFSVYSGDFGLKKPDSQLFEKIELKFGVAGKYVYIADNPKKDFISPNQRGWYTVRLKNSVGIYRDHQSDAMYEVSSRHEIAPLLMTLFEKEK